MAIIQNAEDLGGHLCGVGLKLVAWGDRPDCSSLFGNHPDFKPWWQSSFQNWMGIIQVLSRLLFDRWDRLQSSISNARLPIDRGSASQICLNVCFSSRSNYATLWVWSSGSEMQPISGLRPFPEIWPLPLPLSHWRKRDTRTLEAIGFPSPILYFCEVRWGHMIQDFVRTGDNCEASVK